MAWFCKTKKTDLPGVNKVGVGLSKMSKVKAWLPTSAFLLCPSWAYDSVPLCLLDSVSLAYQRVQKVDCTSLRPVLILGPLLDVVKEMLVNEAPGKFCRCPLGKGCPCAH